MKKFLISIATATCLLLNTGAHAAGSSSGLVGMMIVNSSNFLFFTAGTKAASPVCGNANDQWSLNLSTAVGKSTYAMLLSAQAQAKVVYVFGNGTCNGWGDREDVLYVYAP